MLKKICSKTWLWAFVFFQRSKHSEGKGSGSTAGCLCYGFRAQVLFLGCIWGQLPLAVSAGNPSSCRRGAWSGMQPVFAALWQLFQLSVIFSLIFNMLKFSFCWCPVATGKGEWQVWFREDPKKQIWVQTTAVTYRLRPGQGPPLCFSVLTARPTWPTAGLCEKGKYKGECSVWERVRSTWTSVFIYLVI